MHKNIVVCLTFMLMFSSCIVLSLTQDEAIGQAVIRNGMIYVSHEPIRINSNAGFAAVASSGEGSAGNPWIIENYDINGNGYGYCIYIGNTTDFFVVKNCYLHGASGGSNEPYYFNQGIILYNVNDGTISNNTSSNNIYGIYFSSCSRITIINNTASSNDNCGIYLLSSSRITIINNTASSNGNCGIYLLSSSNYNTIFNNTVLSNTNYGISISSSGRNTVINNTASSNDNSGIFIYSFSNYNIISNNTVSLSTNYGICLFESSGATISNNTVSSSHEGGIYLAASSRNTISNNTVLNNCNGIYLFSSSNYNIINNNNVHSNIYTSIYLAASSRNIISSNTVSSNTDYDIYLSFSSNNNIIINNNISSNAIYGIYLTSSYSNAIYHNNIDMKFNQAYDDGSNQWDNGYPSGGNCWSDYTDVDDYFGSNQNIDGSDGIGDKPYTNIDGGTGAQDKYPLMIWPYTDLVPPMIVSTIPTDNTTGMKTTAGTYKTRFSEQMNTIITGCTTNLPDAVGKWDASGMWFNITYNTLNESTTYYVEFTGHGHKDLSGNALAGDMYKIFTTGDFTAPIADAGPDQTVDEGTLVTFDGSSSTDNVGIDDYIWTFTDETPQTMYGVSAQYTFNNIGFFQVSLTITDAAGNWNTDTMNITVKDATIPIANAGPDQTVEVGAVVSFNGFGSTDNIGVVNYTWAFTDVIPMNLYGADPFYKFNNPGIFVITLNVTDAAGNWNMDTITVTVNDITAPNADAGTDQTVDEGAPVTFNGRASTDNVGIVNYTWEFNDGTLKTLFGASLGYTFDNPGIFVITLNVTDAAGNWNTDTMTVTVNDITAPNADAGTDQTVYEGTPVTFDGSASTDNVGIVNYTWEFNDGMQNVMLYGIAPSHDFKIFGNYKVTLIVRDENGNIDTDAMIVTVKPLDHDGDGVEDRLDAFPYDPAASVDTDGDGYPDAWNPGMTAKDSTTGLILDDFPNNPNKWKEKSSTSHYWWIIIIILIIVLTAGVLLILNMMKGKETTRAIAEDNIEKASEEDSEDYGLMNL